MKDRHLLLGAIVFAFSVSAAHGQFAGEYADKSYQGGGAVFQLSIEGEALVCFCILKKGTSGDANLATELKNDVARDLGKALAPREVIFVGDIPETRNAKVMCRIVRAAYLGEKLGDTSALENPAPLDEIKRAAAAQLD